MDDDRSRRWLEVAHEQSEMVAGWFADGEAFDRAGRLWEAVSAATLAVADPRPGEQVLDACCGTGALAVPAARAVGPAGRVVAVDLAGPLVERLRTRARHESITWLEAVTDDATTAGAADAHDLVACVLGVFFFPDMDSAGEHLVSRARVGGRVCVTTWALGALRQLMPHLVQAAAVHRPEVAGPQGHPASERVQSEAGLRGYLSGVGLADVVVRRVPLEVRLDAELALALLDGSAGRSLLAGLDASTCRSVREDVARRVAGAGPAVDATVLVGLGRRAA